MGLLTPGMAKYHISMVHKTKGILAVTMEFSTGHLALCNRVNLSGCAGFPPIREIREFRENFEDFFQSGKSGKNRGFSAKIREKNFKSGNFFFKPFLNLLNL